MPDHLTIPGRGGNLLVDGKLLEGAEGFALPGAQAAQIPVQSAISARQAFILDIPSAGVMSFSVYLNPADDLHYELYNALGENTKRTYTWRMQGKHVNDIVTAEEISGAGTVELLTVVGQLGDINLNKGTGDEPHPGDFLVKTGGGTSAASDGEKLRVLETDYSTEGKIKIKLGKGQGNPVAYTAAPTAHASASQWRLDRPAIAARFRGIVQAFPLPPTGGGRVIRGNASITITGDITLHVGTPSLVGVV